MKCLFWNVNKQKINKQIFEVTLEKKIDVLALAEYEDNIDELKRMFIASKYDIFELKNLGSRLTIFVTVLPGEVQRIIDTKHYMLFRLKIPKIGIVMFGFVHIFSKMMKDENDYFSKMSKMVADIERKEKELESDYTILAGDFNMNPFEKGMLMAGALYSLPTKREASKRKRIIDDEHYKMFYNPMWRFFNEELNTPGTYFTNPTHTYGLHWNIFDQVIYRPDLIDIITNVSIITKIGEENLIRENNRIVPSDHLPIFFKFKEEEI